MSRQIFLFSPVYDSTAEVIVKQLMDYDRQSSDEITMFINSPGGSVLAMFSIIDMMNIINAPVRTIVLGQAASAAAVIASVGDTRMVSENGRFMLHEVWSIIGGSSSQMKDALEEIEKMQTKLLEILSRATNKSIGELKTFMEKTDRFMSAQEAVMFGLADEIMKEKSAQVIKLSENVNTEPTTINYVKDGLSEVEILRVGNFSHEEYGSLNITQEILNTLVDNFSNNVRGIEISIDYSHEETGEKPAAAWVKNLVIKDQRLVAQVKFTNQGKKLVEDEQYKYASADFVINYIKENGDNIPYVFRGGTLTNRPFIKGMNPIKLSEPNTKENPRMGLQEILNKLKSDFGVDVQSLQAETSDLKNQISALNSKIQELNKIPEQKEARIKELEKQSTDLKNKIVDSEKDQAFNDLLKEGKVIPAQKESVLDTFNTAEDIKKFYENSPVVINTESQGDNGKPVNKNKLTPEEQEAVNSGDYTEEEVIKYRKTKK